MTRGLCATALCVVLCAVCGAVTRAQDRYDDHELTDRFYITMGGFQQRDVTTTLQINAKTPQGGIAAGAVVIIENLFSVDNEASTGRIDGWYRLGKKSRINWTYWDTDRSGLSVYTNDESIDIGEITISQGDFVAVDTESRLLAASYTFSFLNTTKFEAWIGGGLNIQGVKTSIVVDVGGGGVETLEERVKGTIPIPIFKLGGRWNFGKKVRMLVTQDLFGIKIGDYSGKLGNTRLFAEFDITKNFGIGGGFERFRLEVEAENVDFLGRLDRSFTGLSLYLKGQF